MIAMDMLIAATNWKRIYIQIKAAGPAMIAQGLRKQNSLVNKAIFMICLLKMIRFFCQTQPSETRRTLPFSIYFESNLLGADIKNISFLKLLGHLW